MTARLVAEEGILKGLVLSLDQGDQWFIGRDPEVCQLVIEDAATSRKQLLCKTTPTGISIQNESETNPVFVNDEELKEPRILQNGDTLKIGSCTYRFYAEASAQLIQDEAGSENSEESLPLVAHPPQVSQVPQAVEAKGPSYEVAPDLEEHHTQAEVDPVAHPEEDSQHSSIFDEDLTNARSGLAEISFDMAGAGRWLLKVIGGPNNGAEFSMQSDQSYTIGTDPNLCDIVFHDNSVSRQHARITIVNDEKLEIEDLKSRNGTLVDGVQIEGKQPLAPNALVSMGTTSFIVYDREGQMQTIISPLLPSIVKALQQKEESKRAEEAAALAAKLAAEAPKPVEVGKPKEHSNNAMGAFLLLSLITGLMVIIGIGTTTLFKSEPVVTQEHIDTDRILQDAMKPFPSIRWTFNKNTGILFLVGHVLAANDKNQLMYNLQGLKFIKTIDDSGVVIDEYVWREINPILARRPGWGSVSISSPAPGRFVLQGYLQTRKQSEELWDYISNNFSYLDLLEKRVVIEEEVITQVNVALQHEGFRGVSAQLSNGDLSLTGAIPAGKQAVLATLIEDFKKITGVRDVRSFVTEQAIDASMVNLTDKYEVTGFSHTGDANLSVVINGRILTRGDTLDGMAITNIKPNVIFLEKDGTKYRIDYNK